MSLFDRFRRRKLISEQDEIGRCADHIRRTATAATNFLGKPVECEAVASTSRFVPLCAWGIFNPMGPTIASLTLAEVPGKPEHLLFFRFLNPFASGAVVYGILPEAATAPDRLLGPLRMLFSRNGAPGRPLIAGLPTHLTPVAESPLSPSQLKELLFLTTQSEGCGVQDIDSITDRILKYKGDPWARTLVEFKEGMNRITPALYKEAPPRKATSPATRAQFDRWWSAVTDPAHVAAERREMQKAWEGAIKFQRDLRH